jgi:hypothetical protein
VVLEGKVPRVEKIKLSLLTRFEKLTLRKDERVAELARFKKENTYYWITVEADTPQEFNLRKRKLEEIFGDALLRVYPRGYLKVERRESSPQGELLDLKNPLRVLKSYYRSLGRKWDNEVEDFVRKLLEDL